MTREIKFRLWNTEELHMEKVKSMRQISYDWVCISVDKDGEESDWFVPQPLMQYTGLRDKTGVEIYEGDILKSLNRGVGEVKLGRHLFEGSGIASQGWYFGDFQTLDGSLEVIGNIYENPELLQGEE